MPTPKKISGKLQGPNVPVSLKPVLRIRGVFPDPGSDFFPSRIRFFSIPDPDPDFLPIPDAGVKKAPDPGSGFATLVETESLHVGGIRRVADSSDP
jgi:hypothetical protein